MLPMNTSPQSHTHMHYVVVQAAGAGETALSTRLHRDTEFMRKSVRPFSTDLFLS